MENQRKKEIAVALRQYLDARGQSINKFAEENKENISSAYVSLMITGIEDTSKWAKLSDMKWQFIQHKIGMATTWKFGRSKNYEVITELLTNAQQNCKFVALCGYEGAGKTESLNRYCRENANTFYVQFDILSTSKRDFLDAISLAMGINTEMNNRLKVREIIRKMNSLQNPLLILDQFDKLSDGNKLLVQAIYDATEHKAGIVISGTDAMYAQLKKLYDRDKVGFRELWRRISYWQPLFRPTKEIVNTICKANGLQDEKCVKYIFNNSKNYGEIRNMVTGLLDASMRLKRPVELQLLESMNVGEIKYITAA